MKIFDYADLGSKHSWDYSQKGISPEDEGIMPIFETEKEVDMGDLLIIKGVAYCVCSRSGKGNVFQIAYVEILKQQKVFIDCEEPVDKNYTSEITCPYCGAEIESWEMDDGEDEHICDSCNSTFSYQRNVTVEYCSQPVKKASPIVLS